MLFFRMARREEFEERKLTGVSGHHRISHNEDRRKKSAGLTLILRIEEALETTFDESRTLLYWLPLVALSCQREIGGGVVALYLEKIQITIKHNK